MKMRSLPLLAFIFLLITGSYSAIANDRDDSLNTSKTAKKELGQENDIDAGADKLTYQLKSTIKRLMKYDTSYDFEEFMAVLKIIEENYHEFIDPDKIIKGAIKGMLREIDQYSAYYQKEEFADGEEMALFTGKRVLIGIKTNEEDGGIRRITAVLRNSPAEKAGLKIGDIIEEIDYFPVSRMSSKEFDAKLKGKVDTTITFKIYRERTNEGFALTIKRALVDISLENVEVSLIFDGKRNNVLYIKIISMTMGVTDVLLQKYYELLRSDDITGEEIDSVILDLRNNGGGLRFEGVEIADLFIESGIIATFESQKGKEVVSAEKAGPFEKLPIAILMNEYSASASEILISALKDNRDAILIGKKSFGKGVGQEFFDIRDSDGSVKNVLKITTSSSKAPTDKSINGYGIEPDITIAESEPVFMCGLKIDNLDSKVLLEKRNNDCYLVDLPLLTAINSIKTIKFLKK